MFLGQNYRNIIHEVLPPTLHITIVSGIWLMAKSSHQIQMNEGLKKQIILQLNFVHQFLSLSAVPKAVMITQLSDLSSTSFRVPSLQLCFVAQLCLTLCDPMSLPGSSVHWDSPGKNTRVGCHVLLQGIFPTQGLKPGLPHGRRILHQLPGKPLL